MTPIIPLRPRWRAAALALTLAACSPTDLVDVEQSSILVDPETVGTAAGATQLYNFALTTFAARLGGGGIYVPGPNNLVVATGLFTDELMRAQHFNNFTIGLDERTGDTGFGSNPYGFLYEQLHPARIQANQAREALRLHAPGSSVRQAEMLALEALVVVYFAEVFCSGIPLTIVPLLDQPVLTAGFTTQELLQRAVAMFDSAITLAGESVRIANLARVGKGRALLNLGEFADAAAAVASVPTSHVYLAEFDPAAVSFRLYPAKNEVGAFVGPGASYRLQVVDNEGGTGLVWSSDPRTGILTSPATTGPMPVPAKYSRSSAGVLQTAVTIFDNPIRVADGLEARLIGAEAALSTGTSSWLATLNMLRSTCVGADPCAPVPGLTASSLPPLSDPGTADSRLDLLMQERAMWLYLTGHRQGDLRRLARIYSRPRESLWPTGTYNNPGFAPAVPPASTHGTAYGTDVVLTPHPSEQLGNNLYTGCVNLDP